MKCPWCDGEMTLGWIQCRDGLFWTPKKQPVAALSGLGRGSVRLTNNGSDSTRAVHAHRCPVCCKVLIEYDGSSTGHDRG